MHIKYVGEERRGKRTGEEMISSEERVGGRRRKVRREEQSDSRTQDETLSFPSPTASLRSFGPSLSPPSAFTAVVFSLLSPLPLFKIKDSFIALQCL